MRAPFQVICAQIRVRRSRRAGAGSRESGSPRSASVKSSRCASSQAWSSASGRSAKSSAISPALAEVPLALGARGAGPPRRASCDGGCTCSTSWSSLSSRPRVADAVRRDERQAEPPREIDERPGCGAPPRAGGGAAARRGAVRERSRRGARAPAVAASTPSGGERARDRTLVAAGQAVQALRVRRDLLPRDGGLPFRLAERARRDQAAEVPVAGAALDEESETAFPSRPAGGRGQGEGGICRERALLRELVRERPSARPSRAGEDVRERTSAPTSAFSPASRAAL